MNLLPYPFCIKINTNGCNITSVYTELTKLCKNPVKLSLKYYINSLGKKKESPAGFASAKLSFFLVT